MRDSTVDYLVNSGIGCILWPICIFCVFSRLVRGLCNNPEHDLHVAVVSYSCCENLRYCSHGWMVLVVPEGTSALRASQGGPGLCGASDMFLGTLGTVSGDPRLMNQDSVPLWGSSWASSSSVWMTETHSQILELSQVWWTFFLGDMKYCLKMEQSTNNWMTWQK